MNYFVYNGVSSLDMGLRIESKNVFSAPEYDVTFQSIPGRNGDLILPNGRYPNVQVTYSVFLPAKSIAELAEKITKVKAWLYGEQNAYHTLSDSYDTVSGTLESRAGWKGLCRKGMTLLIVLIAHRLDLAMTIGFIANETISIVENAGLMGVPLPGVIQQAIDILTKKAESPASK